MRKVLSGKNALAGQQQFEYEKNQRVLEMLNQFRSILEIMEKDGEVRKGTLIKILIHLKKLPKEQTKAFFEDVKKMSKEEIHALIAEMRKIVDEFEKRLPEKKIIKSRIKIKERIAEKREALEPGFAHYAGKQADTSRIFEKFALKETQQDEILSV